MVGRSRPRRRGTRLSCPASSGFAGPATDRGALPFPESLRRGICTCRGLALIENVCVFGLDHGRPVVITRERVLPFEGIEPPGNRGDRQPALRDESVRGPCRIAPGMKPAFHPLAGSPLVGVLGLFKLRHQCCNTFGRYDGQWRERLTGNHKLLRVESCARDRKRGLHIARR